MNMTQRHDPRAAGFTIIELLIAMAVTLVVMTLACNLVARSLAIRSRENQRSDALADAQRALQGMSREIANTGFGMRSNGIVGVDSGPSSIRVRANLNAYSGQTTSQAATDRDEDIQYRLVQSDGQSYLVRLDVNTSNQTTILANRIDSFIIRYFPSKVNYTPGTCDITAPSVADVADKTAAKYVVLVLCVTLPERGSQGSPGYSPPSRVQLISDIGLRNADLASY
jgi:prepilin-type N-terminal cleavage/methylation domain-containing protein